jgi:hypothetical protein
MANVVKQTMHNLTAWTERQFAATGPYQWGREAIKNSIEAKADHIEFGIEWQAVAKLGVYRRTIADNGCGMTAQELVSYFGNVGSGAKPIKGVGDNFGIGAKISMQTWNPSGVVILSRKDGHEAMIWIVKDEDGDYGLLRFGERGLTVATPSEVVDDDGIDWAAVFPLWIGDHGTVVVLLGDEDHPDTVQGNMAEDESAAVHGLTRYLNRRFWDLSGIEVRVHEMRNERKTRWPEKADETDDKTRLNRVRVYGAKHYLEKATQTGKPEENGVVLLDDDRVTVEWYLWSGELAERDSYALPDGYIAVRYKGELFNLTERKVDFRQFGITAAAVQERTVLIVEPPLIGDQERFGVFPNDARNALLFTGHGEKSAPVSIPLVDTWGPGFAHRMPVAIKQALERAAEANSEELDDDYRRRLANEYSMRWATTLPIGDARGELAAQITHREVSAIEGLAEELPSAQPESPRAPRPSRPPRTRPRLRAELGGGASAKQSVSVPDVPAFYQKPASEFDPSWLPARYEAYYTYPRTNEVGPAVLINNESPLVASVVQHFAEQYLDHHAAEIRKIVIDALGQNLVCKVAHMQSLTADLHDSKKREFFTDEAMALAAVGLMDLETLVRPKLKSFAHKKAA